MPKYNHKEAFALMWYGCKMCGHRERMWNSRDGVTPFGCRCPSCGESTLTHVDWQMDALAPEHKPYCGQRVWRDGTPEEAEAIMRKRIASYKAQGHNVLPEYEAQLIEGVRNGDSDFRPGWPTLVVVIEAGVVP